MSVLNEPLASGGAREARAPRERSEAVACALVALITSVTGCAQGGDDERLSAEDENVASGQLASTFVCASAFGLIGAAIYMTGDIVVPSGDVESVATTPAGSPTIDCTNGGLVTIQWEPVKVEVPVHGGTGGKILLQNFTVTGTPGALLPGECVPPTPCYPGTLDPLCADETDLLTFDTQACTLADFAAGACELSRANANVCGTL